MEELDEEGELFLPRINKMAVVFEQDVRYLYLQRCESFSTDVRLRP